MQWYKMCKRNWQLHCSRQVYTAPLGSAGCRRGFIGNGTFLIKAGFKLCTVTEVLFVVEWIIRAKIIYVLFVEGPYFYVYFVALIS